MKRFNWFGLMPMICAIVMAVTTPAWAADEIKIGMIGAMRFIPPVTVVTGSMRPTT